jgi:predicted secreted Zn-dependent protease
MPLSTLGRRVVGLLVAALCIVSSAGVLAAGPALTSDRFEVIQLVSGAAIEANGQAAQGAGPGGSAVDAAASRFAVAAPPEAPDEQAPAAPRPGVSVTALPKPYPVEGSDIRSLLASLRQRGPSDGQGTWAASTAWVFRWSYRPVDESTCRVASAQVSLELTSTYPEWATPPEASPVVVTAWQGYLARVDLHEQGHRDIAQAAADELQRALEKLPSQRSCGGLAAAAKTTASEILARHAEAQATYDRETGHGVTQGAVLTGSQ